VLVFDECECALGPDCLPARASFSSIWEASVVLGHAVRETRLCRRAALPTCALHLVRSEHLARGHGALADRRKEQRAGRWVPRRRKCPDAWKAVAAARLLLRQERGVLRRMQASPAWSKPRGRASALWSRASWSPTRAQSGPGAATVRLSSEPAALVLLVPLDHVVAADGPGVVALALEVPVDAIAAHLEPAVVAE
jgi:hypothetical protein